MRVRVVAPSDLSFLFDRCPRCYWMKLNGLKGTSDVLPGVFREIDRAQKAGITIETLRALKIPAVEFIPGERVLSEPAEYGGSMLAISGFTDRRVRLDDGTVGVIDFKTSKPRVDNMAKYWRAMSAYQYAIEHSEHPEEVTMLALVVYTPVEFHLRANHPTQAYYTGNLARVDVEVDRPKFDRFLTNLGTMLAREDMPESGSCDVCRHADAVVLRRMALLLKRVSEQPELGPAVADLIAAHVKL